jgi:hypothetical protein
MKSLTYLYVFGLFSLLCLVPFHAQARPVDCDGGLVGVTVVNPNGKVRELCVRPNTVDMIGEKSDRVIKAVCPCFSLEDLDSLPMLSNSQVEKGYTLNCHGVGEPSSEFISVSLMHPEGGCCTICEGFVAVDYTSEGTISSSLSTSGCSALTGESHPWEGDLRDLWSREGDCGVVSEGGLAACSAVIMASKWWAMCSQ